MRTDEPAGEMASEAAGRTAGELSGDVAGEPPGEAAGTPRRMRADARDNRERVLRAARAAFAEEGPHASLNKIAQRAGVGAGTLYRHFPTLDALLVAIIGADVEALCEHGRALLDHPSPGEALTTWLRAVAVHATAMRGLVATRMAAQAAHTPRSARAAHTTQTVDTAQATDAAHSAHTGRTPDTKAADGTLAACHDAILAAGGALLERARDAGAANEETGIADLLTLLNAAAWASEQATEDEHLLDRLLSVVARGLR